MRHSLAFILLMGFSIAVSVLLASMARIISTEAGVFKQYSDDFEKKFADYVKVIDGTPNELMWFVQVSLERL